MKYPIILFDADGVLLKSGHLFTEQLEVQYHIPVSRTQPFFKGVFRNCSRGNADVKEELKKVIDDWGWKGTVQKLTDFWFTYGTQIDFEILMHIQLLRKSGVDCYLTTDQEKYRGEFLRTTLVNNDTLSGVFFSAEIGYTKNEPGFFEYVYDALLRNRKEISRDQILLVDDDEKNIEVARAFGFVTHLYKNLEGLKKLIN